MSEGRSITYGVYATVRCVLNVGILDPIIANLKKCRVWMFGLAGEVATLLPGFVMLIITFVCQKNSVKPSCKMISNEFSGETPQVFKIGASALFSYFVSMLPSIFMQKYLFKAATSINQISKYSICLGPINLLRNMENAWVIGTMNGLGPASSYAYSKKRLTRYRDLFFASFTLPFLILIINIIIYAKPKLLFSLFIKDADIISDIHRFINTPFILNWLYPVAIGAQHMLNAMKRPLIAVIPSIATSLTIVASVLGFYYTNKTNPNRILWAFPIADGCMFIVSALCLIFPFREIKNAKKEMSSSLTQSLI